MKTEHLLSIHAFYKLSFNINDNLECFQMPTKDTGTKYFLNIV